MRQYSVFSEFFLLNLSVRKVCNNDFRFIQNECMFMTSLAKTLMP